MRNATPAQGAGPPSGCGWDRGAATSPAGCWMLGERGWTEKMLPFLLEISHVPIRSEKNTNFQ